MKKQTPRQVLRAAIDRACVANGDVQWCHGYRTASKNDNTDLQAKEQQLWKVVGYAERRLEGALSVYTRAISLRARQRQRKRHA